MNEKKETMNTQAQVASGSQTDPLYQERQPLTELYISKFPQRYINPTPGEMPIMALGYAGYQYDEYGTLSKDEEKLFDSRYLDLLKEAGFNCVQTSISDVDKTETNASNCATAGMKMILRGPDLSPVSETVFVEQKKKNGEIVREEENLPKLTVLHAGTASKPDSEPEISEAEEVSQHLNVECSQDSRLTSWKEQLTGPAAQVAPALYDRIRWLRLSSCMWDKETCGGYQIGDEPSILAMPLMALTKDIILSYDESKAGATYRMTKGDTCLLEADAWNGMVFSNLCPLYGEDNLCAVYTDMKTDHSVLDKDGSTKTLPLFKKRDEYGAAHIGFSGCQSGNYVVGDKNPSLAALPIPTPNNTGTTYRTFMGEFERIFRPAVWCVDDYFLHREVKTTENNGKSWAKLRSEKYFASLEIFRKQALSTDRPMWVTVRCGFRPEVTVDNEIMQLVSTALKIETRCSLAAGAKGLVFWNTASGVSTTYPVAPILPEDWNGSNKTPGYKTTELFDTMREVIPDIKAKQNLFLNSSVVKTLLIGDHIETAEEYKEKGKTGINFGPVTVTTPNTNGAFYLAHYETHDGEFIVCVNLATHTVRTGGWDVKLYETTELVVKADREMIDLTDLGQINTLPAGAKKISSDVAPGDWRIFFLPK